MASNALKGITVKIGGDTTELTAALKQIKSTSDSNKGALREVEDALRSNADSLVLLTQKQKYAKDEADNLRLRLQKMTEALGQVPEGSEAFNKLQRMIIATQGAVEKMDAKAAQTIEQIKSGNVEMLADAIGQAREKTEGLSAALKDVASGAAMAVGSDLVSAVSSLASSATDTALAWDSADAKIAADRVENVGVRVERP